MICYCAINFIFTKYISQKVFYVHIISVRVVITFKANSGDILYTPISDKTSIDSFSLLLLSVSRSNIAEPIKIFRSIHASLCINLQRKI